MSPARVFWALLLVALPASAAPAANRLVVQGVPAPSRQWMGADYRATFDLLSRGTVTLPRLADSEEREIFTRLVNLENVSFSRNRTLPLNTRINDLMQVIAAANGITKLYAARVIAGEPLHAELAQLVGFSLHLTSAMLEIVDELLPTLPRDETFAVRMDGLRKVRSSTETIFRGAILSLSEREVYDAQDIATMLSALVAVSPKLKEAFSGDFILEATRTVTAELNRATVASEQAALRQLLQILEQPAVNGNAPPSRS